MRLLAATLVATSLSVLPVVVTSTAQPGPLPPQPLALTVSSATRLLVLAAHPDDEALGAAGLIARVRARGGVVQVVVMTSGDAFPEAVQAIGGIQQPTAADFRNFGTLREGETRAAMGLLGVPPTRIIFLGFPDEGLCLLASRYLYDKRALFESPYTDRERPPIGEAVVRGARYRGVDVRREIERIASEFKPTVIAVSHPEDEHPDHCSTHIFAREALRAVRLRASFDPRILHYLIHYGQWPLDRPDTGDALQPPLDFPPNEGRWLSLALSPGEVALKERAILSYRSQVGVIGRFMRGFVKTNELFLEGEPQIVPDCWCDGENVATEAEPPRERRRR